MHCQACPSSRRIARDSRVVALDQLLSRFVALEEVQGVAGTGQVLGEADSGQVRKVWGRPWVEGRRAVDLGRRMVEVGLDHRAPLEEGFQVLAEPMMEVAGPVASESLEEDSILMGRGEDLLASESYLATGRWAFVLRGVATLEAGTAESACSMADLFLVLQWMSPVLAQTQCPLFRRGPWVRVYVRTESTVQDAMLQKVQVSVEARNFAC